MLEQFNNGILTIDSGLEGGIVTIVACTHGDEVVGVEVLEYLLNILNIEKKLLKGKLNLIIGNLKGYKEGKKFIDTDFNRIWDFDNKLKNTYEYKRALEIKTIIGESDYILDIHATTNPSPTFIIPLGIEDELIKFFNVKFVIENIIGLLHGLPLIGYTKSQKNNSKSLVIEAGQVGNTDTIDLAIANTLTFLEFYGFIKGAGFNEVKKKIFRVDKCMYADTMDISFKYTQKKPKSFQKIHKGDLVYIDGDKPVYADNNYYSLMPTSPRYLGEEILYLMTLKK